MVTQPDRSAVSETSAPPTRSPTEPAFLPDRPQPWHVVSMLLGVPGATATAVLCTAAAVVAARDPLLAAAAVLGIAVWFTLMSVVWIGVARERP